MTRLIFMLKDLIWIMEINSVPCMPGGLVMSSMHNQRSIQ